MLARSLARLPPMVSGRSFSTAEKDIHDAEVVGETSQAENAAPAGASASPAPSVTGEFEKKGFQAETLKLLEIVTHPDFRSAEEVVVYLKKHF